MFESKGDIGVGLNWVMRISLSFATGALLLASIDVADASDPTLLAETNAYLLGNAHRCGVADDRVERAGTMVRDSIAAAARDSAELAAAESRYIEIFAAIAVQAKTETGSRRAKS